MANFRLPSEIYTWSLFYFLLTVILRWKLQFDMSILLYLVGAVFGLYLMELAGKVMGIMPEIFRTALMQIIIGITTIYVLTSSDSRIGQGVVLFLNLRLLHLQYRQFTATKSLLSWFGQSLVITESSQKLYLSSIVCLFLLESFLFVMG